MENGNITQIPSTNSSFSSPHSELLNFAEYNVGRYFDCSTTVQAQTWSPDGLTCSQFPTVIPCGNPETIATAPCPAGFGSPSSLFTPTATSTHLPSAATALSQAPSLPEPTVGFPAWLGVVIVLILILACSSPWSIPWLIEFFQRRRTPEAGAAGAAGAAGTAGAAAVGPAADTTTSSPVSPTTAAPGPPPNFRPPQPGTELRELAAGNNRDGKGSTDAETTGSTGSSFDWGAHGVGGSNSEGASPARDSLPSAANGQNQSQMPGI